jgi:hypothetical protein
VTSPSVLFILIGYCTNCLLDLDIQKQTMVEVVQELSALWSSVLGRLVIETQITSLKRLILFVEDSVLDLFPGHKRLHQDGRSISSAKSEK